MKSGRAWDPAESHEISRAAEQSLPVKGKIDFIFARDIVPFDLPPPPNGRKEESL